VQQVEVLQCGDDPVIEPGQAMVRVILTPAGEDPEEALHAFERANRAAIEDLGQTIARAVPSIGRVEFTSPAARGARTSRHLDVGGPARPPGLGLQSHRGDGAPRA
jgi:hypothetical protein